MKGRDGRSVPSASALDSLTWNLKVSKEKCFLLTPISLSSNPPYQDMHFFFPLFFPELLCLYEAQSSREKPNQDCVAQRQTASVRTRSLLKSVTVRSYVVDLCVVCFGYFYIFFLPQSVISPLVCWCPYLPWKSLSGCLRSLGQPGLSHPSTLMPSLIGRKENQENWNTYLKEKGLGRTSLHTLHSTSLCDY